MRKTKNNRIEITPNGIKKIISRFDYAKSIVEYVWNGFDAKADSIHVDVEFDTIFHKIIKISVSDNGTGIDFEKLADYFSPFYDSNKIENNNSYSSEIHGKNGIGRLTYSSFAGAASWNTVYKAFNKTYKYEIESHATNIDHYTFTPIVETDEAAGTIVTITDLKFDIFGCDELRDYLIEAFCWYLALYPNKHLYINGEEILYKDFCLKDENSHFVFNNHSFDLRIICWKKKIDEYSKYYYLDSTGKELYKENTSFNNKGDHFYHSVFIKSSLFDNFDLNEDDASLFANKKSPEYQFAIQKSVEIIKKYRIPFLKENAKPFVRKMNVESAFNSKFKSSPVFAIRKETIEQTLESIYVVQPSLLSNLNENQSKTIIRLLDLAISGGEVDSLFVILNDIIDLQEDERKELAELLKLTSLSNVIKTISVVEKRLKTIRKLKELLYNTELNANEVTHIQTMVENNYWIIGEEYSLFASCEDNVRKALEQYISKLHLEYDEISDVDEKDSLKQFDILLTRQSIDKETIENVLIELKHPKITLGKKQLNQVREYMNIITKQSPFNASNTNWKFYLLGNKINQDIKDDIENAKIHGEKSLVLKIKDGQMKIYVKTWSEVFNDYEIKYKHLLSTLDINRNKLLEDLKFSNADDVLNLT